MLAGQDLSIVALDRHHPADGHREEERDHDDRLRARGRAHGRACRRATPSCRRLVLRFRPIMMTTLAALFGALPLALESGTGSELRNPLGITIIGGLLLEPVADALHTPVIYLAHGAPAGRACRAATGAADEPDDATCQAFAARARRRPRSHEHSPDPASAGRSAPRCWPSGCCSLGIVAYRFLPVASMPTVDFPTISASTPTGPAPTPRPWRRRCAAPLERRLGGDSRRHRDAARSSPARPHHRAVRPQPQHRQRRARRTGSAQRCGRPRSSTTDLPPKYRPSL